MRFLLEQFQLCDTHHATMTALTVLHGTIVLGCIALATVALHTAMSWQAPEVTVPKDTIVLSQSQRVSPVTVTGDIQAWG